MDDARAEAIIGKVSVKGNKETALEEFNKLMLDYKQDLFPGRYDQIVESRAMFRTADVTPSGKLSAD